MTVPSIPLRLPRPLRSIHQIELSSFCNLSCVYCPQNTKHNEGLNLFGTEVRPRMHMERATFERALKWVRFFIGSNAEQRRELNLAGLGESTLHPLFVDFVGYAHELIAEHGGHVSFTTNGLLMTDDLAQTLAKITAGTIAVFVSLHRPEKAGPAVEACRRAGILAGVSNDPALASVDWAGQVRWTASADPDTRPCPWIREGQGYVFADGRISTCAFDASAKGVIGHVDLEPSSAVRVAPYALCATCDQVVGVDGYEQRRALPVIQG